MGGMGKHGKPVEDDGEQESGEEPGDVAEIGDLVLGPDGQTYRIGPARQGIDRRTYRQPSSYTCREYDAGVSLSTPGAVTAAINSSSEKEIASAFL